MKSKNFSKNLILNKKTVADLSNKEIKAVIGGEIITLNTWCPGSCHPWPSGCNSIYPKYCVCHYG
jgi:hypothetical protein